jgi:hypothetical protein
MTQPSDPSYVSQVGGSHYGTKYGHWDYCKDANVGYLEGHATKYLYRWRRKGGVQDLEKALSFVEKIMVGNEDTQRLVIFPLVQMVRFFDENNVPVYERYLIRTIFDWRTYEDLSSIKENLINFIAEAKAEEPSTSQTQM